MFATLSDMFSGGEDLPRWSRTVAAMMGGGSLCMQIKSCLPFSNSNPQSALAANCLDGLASFFQIRRR